MLVGRKYFQNMYWLSWTRVLKCIEMAPKFGFISGLRPFFLALRDVGNIEHNTNRDFSILKIYRGYIIAFTKRVYNLLFLRGLPSKNNKLLTGFIHAIWNGNELKILFIKH